jgi:hypothetical protein
MPYSSALSAGKSSFVMTLAGAHRSYDASG